MQTEALAPHFLPGQIELREVEPGSDERFAAEVDVIHVPARQVDAVRGRDDLVAHVALEIAVELAEEMAAGGVELQDEDIVLRSRRAAASAKVDRSHCETGHPDVAGRIDGYRVRLIVGRGAEALAP